MRPSFAAGLLAAVLAWTAAATAEDRTDTNFTTVTPIFSQLVMFTLPAGFETVFENVKDGSYIREAVLNGETVDQWSEMITITGAKDMAEADGVSPRRVMGRIAQGFEKACPQTYAAAEIGELEFGDYEALAAVVGCGDVAGRSESAMIVTIEGDTDYYTIQWAERGPPSATPPEYDVDAWKDRLEKLGPIKLCDKVEGEAPPYPSCVADE